VSARAAVEAARAVFEFSRGLVQTEATTSPEWHATSARLNTARLRSAAMWQAAEHVMQLAVGNTAMTGQTLIGEVRRQQRITLDDAHALVSLYGWYEQIHHPVGGAASAHVDQERPPSEFEQRIAKEVWRALEHAGQEPPANVPASLPPKVVATETVREASTSTLTSASASTLDEDAPVQQRRTVSSGMVLLLIACVLVGSAAVWRVFVGQGEKDFLEGVAAYQRGANEVARIAFTKAAEARPDDPVTLVYLGRIARDERDLVQAKAYLERAIRLTPPNAMALREMGATLLLEGNPELARRFYVRAVELDPGDKLAQGFLGCALQQLGRSDEAARWAERAGQGEWTACIRAATAPPAPPAAPPRRK
jgi:tetratricopeptide (TPR) repeat protein